MRRFASMVALACVAMAVSLGTAPASFSQEEGVTLDPGDPAAKEYALPHEEARREAGKAPDAKVQPGARDSALFGEGVEPDGAATPPSREPNGAATDPETGKTKRPARAEAARTPDADAALAALAARGSDADEESESAGPASTVALIGGGASALLAVFLGGFGLRAMRGSRES